MSPQSLERALADLAERADHHLVVDRVTTVHRRARRAAARRTATGVGALAAAAAAGVLVLTAGGRTLLGLDDVPPAGRSTVVTTPQAPSLKVTLEQDPALAAAMSKDPGGVAVVVRVTLKGWVPQPVNAAGEPATVATDNLLGLRMQWGEDGYDAARPQYSCIPAAKLVEVDTSFPMTHYYARPGTYQATYTTAACAPVGQVVATLTVTAKAAG